MSELLNDKLPVGLRKSKDGLRYELVATVEGSVLPFASFTEGQFEVAQAEAKAEAEEKASKSK